MRSYARAETELAAAGGYAAEAEAARIAANLQHAERLEGLLKGYGFTPQIHRPGVASLVAEQQEEGAVHGLDLLEAPRTRGAARGGQAAGGRLEIRLGPLHRGFALPLRRD